MSNAPLLQVKNLHTSFYTDAGEVRAVNGISYNLDRARTVIEQKNHVFSLYRSPIFAGFEPPVSVGD